MPNAPRRVLIPYDKLSGQIGNLVHVRGWKIKLTFEIVGIVGNKAELRKGQKTLFMTVTRLEYVNRHLPQEILKAAH